MQLDIGQWIIIGLCAVLIAGYAGGYYANRRLAEQVVVWLHNGLKRWGRVTVGERLGGLATGGRLNVKDANPTFQSIETVFLLSPRENLIFWLFDWLRGQQDALIIKINLQAAPKKNLLFEVGSRREKDFRQAVEKENLTVVEPTAGGLDMAVVDKDTPLAEPLNHFLERYGKQLIRMSIGKRAPHIIIRARLRPLLNCPADDFFSSIEEMIL